jgi:hypothetical protein
MLVASLGNLFLTLLFSLGFGQTAHLNVLAVPVPAAMASPAPPMTGPAANFAVKPKGICDITLSFFDGQSNQLATNEVWINPGSSASISLPSFRIPNKGDGLAYGEAQLLPDSDPSCQITSSLDITGPDGNTTVLMPLQGGGGPAVTAPVPTPTPTSMPVG